ncbi:MAG: polysaccharide deacetylase [Firmicutes bacterium]|nr:polysaccharide deacetylase [Bacillota bacterium]
MRGDAVRSIVAFAVILSLMVFSIALSTASGAWLISMDAPLVKVSSSAAASSPPPDPAPAPPPVEQTAAKAPDPPAAEPPATEPPVKDPPQNPTVSDDYPSDKPIKNTNPSAKKIAFLTFDDGPSEEVTPIILDVLREHKVKGTFFVVGFNAERHPEVLQRIAAEGHRIGNHSYSHRIKSIYRDSNVLLDEIQSCDNAIASATGLHPRIFRAPGGSRPFLKPALAAKVTEAGYQYFDWNVCPGDAVVNGLTADQMTRITLQQASTKSYIIVLLHDSYTMQQTAKALPRIIKGLQEQGFTFQVIEPDTAPIHF